MRRLPIFVLLCVFSATSPARQLISVGRNVEVSAANSSRTHFEVQVAADPTNPSRLVACSMISPSDPVRSTSEHKTIVYTSTDGGKSWQPTFEMKPGRFISRDPTCVFGPDGTAYFAAFGWPFDAYQNDGLRKAILPIYRSSDGGQSWSTMSKVEVFDRPFLTVDSTASKYHGRVYIAGNGSLLTVDDSTHVVSMPEVVYSTDGGRSFERPTRLVGSPTRLTVGPSNDAIFSDGSFIHMYAEVPRIELGGIQEEEVRHNQQSATLKALISHDGGDTFDSPVTISDFGIRFYQGINNLPVVTIDGSDGPYKDRAYVAWPDTRSGRAQILLSHSSDEGKTWSKPVVVDDDDSPGSGTAGPNDFMPTIAVNSQGVLGIMWYDRRDNPDNLGWYARFSASLDGGETFLPSVRIAEAPQSVNQEKPVRLETETNRRSESAAKYYLGRDLLETDLGVPAFMFMGGDTAGLAADADGVFHPVWVDNRTGVPQLWTSAVVVNGRAIRNGSPELKVLIDVTPDVALDFTSAHYDPATHLVAVDASLVNTSSKPLVGPIKVRILHLDSAFGRTELIGATLGGANTDQILDFSDLLHANTLAAGARTEPKHLQFRLPAVTAYHIIGARYAVEFVNLKMKAFAKGD